MSLEERLDRIEARLLSLERLVKVIGNKSPQPSSAPPPAILPDGQPRAVQINLSQPAALQQPVPAHKPVVQNQESFPVANILGWAGATALVLASIYLVVLGVYSGWLTPSRQILLAMLGGSGCIGLGLFFRDKDANYASLLPAAGIVILFLSIYGAHNFYHLIETTFATSAVILVCVISLWLNRLFSSEIYALFAVTGSYTAPVFMGGSSFSIMDLIIYFACWSTVFSLYSIRVQSRSVYILAMYLAFVIFDFKWSRSLSEAWMEALIFQTVHFLIFVVAASIYSTRIARLSIEAAIAHIPALVLFYFVQYNILAKHLPMLAPWVAMGSAAFMLLCYFLVSQAVGSVLEGGRLLISSYVALVVLHAVYFESVPAHLAPWAGLVIVTLAGVYALLRNDVKAPGIALWVVSGLIFAINYFHLIFWNTLISPIQDVPGKVVLAFFYAAELYVAYYLTRSNGGDRDMGSSFLYAGHVAMMAWMIQIIDTRFIVSLTWGFLALGCLFLALARQDKILGQSSLIIFAASILKALLYDIAYAAPGLRITSLFVLGAMLYLGGWLYKKVSKLEPE